MKKCILAAILLTALSFSNLLSGAAAQKQDFSEFRYDEPVHLRISLSSTHNLEAFRAVSEVIAKNLNIYADIELRPTDYEGENYFKSLLAMGEMSDLCVYNSGALFQSLHPQVYFVDLSDEPFVDRLDDTFASAVSVNGALYGVPAGSSYAGGWLYNIELHEQYGLEIPKTWGQLMANCESIKRRGGTPIIAGYKDGWCSQIVLLADHHNLVHDLPDWTEQYTCGSATYANSPDALAGFKKLYELSSRKLLQPNAAETSYEEACRMFANGEGVYMPMITSAISLMNTMVPGVAQNIGIFGQPGSDPSYQGITIWLPAGIYISNTSENIEVAKRWVNFFLSDECQQVFLQTKTLPGINEIHGFDSVSAPYPYLETLLDYQSSGRTTLALEFTSPLKGSSLTKITQECALGLITPKAAAYQYGQDTERLSLMLQMLNDQP